MQEEVDILLLPEEFQPALLGTVEGWHPDGSRFLVAAYDEEKCIEILIEDGLSPEDARQHFDHNIAGAYAGPGTPAFVTLGAAVWGLD